VTPFPFWLKNKMALYRDSAATHTHWPIELSSSYFLVISGPLGRFLKERGSPLKTILRDDHARYPTIAQARDVFSHNLFRKLRNGVGHWSFLWQENNEFSQIAIVDWETGETDFTITLLEAEAFHLVAFSVIEILDEEIFSRVNPSLGST
jgi:hypothetical protein